METPSRSTFALEIDQVADAFEAELKAGQRPDPGAFLARLPEAARRALLVELVRVEVEYRRKAGEAASEAQYLRGYLQSYSAIPGLENDRARVSSLPALPATIDQFELLQELGAGGMGIVYLARDTQLDRQVAIKVLKPGPDGSAGERLLREAKSAAKLNHPNTVSVYQVLEREGRSMS